MRYDVRCTACNFQTEISKPMAAPLPKCSKCGSQVRHRFTSAPPVQFRGHGFYTTDVSHFEKQVGKDRADKFFKRKDAAEKRAAAGKQTNYERRLDVLDKTFKK